MVDPIKAMREAAASALCSLSRHDGGLCPVRCSACIRDADAALIAGLRALPGAFMYRAPLLARQVEVASGEGADGPAAATVAPDAPL